MTALDRSISDIVLIVDDVPENLALLHDALDDAGHTVLVATDGESALLRARQSLPDVILLDAVMPGLDGFEVARRLKADFTTRHIPIVFMTGLTETEHVVAAFAAGGADYVTKPIRPAEVLARIAAHVQNARQMKQARSALDAFGQATVAVRVADGRLVWQTPLARRLLRDFFAAAGEDAPLRLLDWIHDAELARREGREPVGLLAADGSRRLLASFHDQTGDAEWLVVLREENDASAIESLIAAFRLTQKEAEVLYWVTQGKTSKDIGDILGSSPRTVNKHLEHVFEKLGVETRTAAANLAMSRMRSGSA
ncbi:MAG TPA: DNA-binding response regulator [Zoogloea sp.]|uniref:DNA-binding response regulator n=1 Tax=Zoogloea sp. TaxID=49181 RepID=UPI002C97C03B|nr:DNA-binding response regulator [Zoogloea sp.]HMV18468.1 DNA-binding response regulator [Rhodocyclaceae bacterium]HMV64250.1 DNA-binding response regulator [Rhodocyclaceae bacterium]HMY49499.1 DNA-binding response regulator [Rhodocyclaceae bacterium]HMZ77241.1 DNA-binding response regulator [Rhodocyclaceae bacterium]HNA68984.1 DNA-binding response regulator [Rhodocyclaceae bacterium]